MEYGKPKKDIVAYDEAAAECRKIFIERREKYGSHLDRGLDYHLAGLKLKCSRFADITDLSVLPDKDTLIDLVDYVLMALSKNQTIGAK